MDKKDELQRLYNRLILRPRFSDLAGQPFLACQGESLKDFTVRNERNSSEFCNAVSLILIVLAFQSHLRKINILRFSSPKVEKEKLNSQG